MFRHHRTAAFAMAPGHHCLATNHLCLTKVRPLSLSDCLTQVCTQELSGCPLKIRTRSLHDCSLHDCLTIRRRTANTGCLIFRRRSVARSVWLSDESSHTRTVRSSDCLTKFVDAVFLMKVCIHRLSDSLTKAHTHGLSDGLIWCSVQF